MFDCENTIHITCDHLVSHVLSRIKIKKKPAAVVPPLKTNMKNNQLPMNSLLMKLRSGKVARGV